jgi:UDP-glucose 4-epimerase
MTILVTGSAGHLGEALMRLLRARADEARGIDLKPSPFTDLVGTITDRGFVREAMAGVRAVLHTATLHKPHVVTHSRQDFVDTNVSGTLVLLEEAVRAGVDAFVQTSTTSTFGDAMAHAPGRPATWIDEDVLPIPRNVYAATKLAAEHLCREVARNEGLPVTILRTSRFFPEDDDSAAARHRFSQDNLQALELLYRRADIADMASAHLLAIERAKEAGVGPFIVSATTPFHEGDLAELGRDAGAVVRSLYPESEALFAARGWRFFETIDRVYSSRRAQEALGWRPKYGFRHVLDCLAQGRDFRSELALAVGAKGYHDEVFADGPYPV